MKGFENMKMFFTSDRDEAATKIFCLLWGKTLKIKNLLPKPYRDGNWFFKHENMYFSGDVMNNIFKKNNRHPEIRYSLGNLFPLPTNLSKPSLNSWKGDYDENNIYQGEILRDRMDLFLIEVQKYYSEKTARMK
jgi:hypothetical protein